MEFQAFDRLLGRYRRRHERRIVRRVFDFDVDACLTRETGAVERAIGKPVAAPIAAIVVIHERAVRPEFESASPWLANQYSLQFVTLEVEVVIQHAVGAGCQPVGLPAAGYLDGIAKRERRPAAGPYVCRRTGEQRDDHDTGNTAAAPFEIGSPVHDAIPAYDLLVTGCVNRSLANWLGGEKT